MAWGFRKNKEKAITLHQTMGRIINGSFSARDLCQNIDQSDEHRGDSRVKRNNPVVVFGPADSDGKISATVGFTVDMSMSGIATYSTRPMSIGASIVSIGESDSRVLIAAECIQSSQKELGCFLSRFQLTEILKQNEHVMLLQILEQLETKPAPQPR